MKGQNNAKKNSNSKPGRESKGNNSKSSSFRRGSKARDTAKSNNCKSEGYGNADDKDISEQTGKNDWQWYAKNPQLLKDVASFMYGWASGKPLLMGDSETFNTRDGRRFNIPGICTLKLIPSLPYTEYAQDSINVAARKEYSFLRHTLSADLPYDMVELFDALYAMAEVYSYINYLRREYGKAFLYANENRYVPEPLITQAGANATDSGDGIMTDLAKFRAGINLLTVKASALAVPASITIFNRKAMLYANVYTSGTSIKDQLYQYAPAGFYVYSEVDKSKAGAHLYLEPFNGPLNEQDLSGRTMDDLIQFGNDMLEPLLASQDIALISSNILRAYGDGGILKVTTLPENFTITPVFDIGVLEQMANAEILDGTVAQALFSKDRFSVTQKLDGTQLQMVNTCTPYLLSSELSDDPTLGLNSSPAASIYAKAGYKSILTTTTAFTDPGLTLESTRLKFVIEKTNITVGSTSKPGYKFHFPTEVCVGAYYCNWELSQNGTTDVVMLATYNQKSLFHWAGVGAQLSNEMLIGGKDAILLSIRSFFRFAPQLFFARYATTADTAGKISKPYPFFDVDNFTIIGSSELVAMNDVVTLSLFDAPGVAMRY